MPRARPDPARQIAPDVRKAPLFGLLDDRIEVARLADSRLAGDQEEPVDLFRADLPSVAGKNIESKYRLMTGQALDQAGQESWRQIERTIEQFLASDVYLLTVPMWNFGIPYVLKYYIDAIVQPGYLFRYTPDGRAEGLVHGKRMLVVVSSGGDYSSEFMAPFNFVESYLRAVFGFVGITDSRVFHAQGMDVGTESRNVGQQAAIRAVREYAQSAEWRPLPASVAPALVA